MDSKSDGNIIPECSYLELFEGKRLQPLAKAQSSGYKESWKKLEEALGRKEMVPSRYAGFNVQTLDPNANNIAFCCFSDPSK